MAAQNDIATGLSKIGTVLRAAAWQESAATGLTPTQGQILVYLAARGPARVSAVADEIAVTQPTASDAVAALVRKGLIKRQRDAADGRAVQLAVTAKGRRLAGGIAAWPDALLAAVDALDPVEQGAVLRGLTKMIRVLQVQGAVPVQRMCATCQYFRPHVHDDAARPHHCAFVDAAFGDAALRLDCGDHVEADAVAQGETWDRFAGAAPA